MHIQLSHIFPKRIRSAFSLCVFLMFFSIPSHSTTFETQPYLQNATPDSIWIMWITDTNIESLVEYGTSAASLTQSVSGNAVFWNNKVVHETVVVGLTPDTEYFYRVTTQDAVSDVYRFKTPPSAASDKSFRFAVISDSQNQAAHTLKQVEIINDGIIDYIADNYSSDIPENLAFLAHAGDLVEAGAYASQYLTQHFNEQQNLIRSVPLYPVPGNHEIEDSGNNLVNNYKAVHNLPPNGSQGELEHWYYMDYSNVRLIGLDTAVHSNRNSMQLNWLENTLDAACQNSNIDFVFALFHHPYKSEMWTGGNLSFSGDLIARLENFTAQCAKPSAHFFGHTHAYSRGQSRDVPHVWVNAATAEGAIDYWGEYGNQDYAEFQLTEPKYGFMIVDVVAGSQPSFSIRRISRGNDTVSEDNIQTDIITLRANNLSPATPNNLTPLDNAEYTGVQNITLGANPFSDPDVQDSFLEAHWQVTAIPGDFTNLTQEKWTRIENWYSPEGPLDPSNNYFSVNTVVDNDLTHTKLDPLPIGTYHWRVRYRDSSLAWSDWSAPTRFSTHEAPPSNISENLLANPGAESNVSHWQVLTGAFEALHLGDCGSPQPHAGLYNFALGGICANEGPYGEAKQMVDISDLATDIDSNKVNVNFGGQMRTWDGSDTPEIWLEFLDLSYQVIGSTTKITTAATAWTEVLSQVSVPAATRHIAFHISGTRNAGVDNDSYFDNLTLNTITPVPAPQPGNLLMNAGAEEGIAYWNPTFGTFEVLVNAQCGTVAPQEGNANFALGGICSGEGTYGEVQQSVDVSASADSIDSGHTMATYSGYLRNWSGSDLPEIWIVFKDSNHQTISSATKLNSLTPSWSLHSNNVTVPVGTRTIDFHMSGTRNSGTDNDSYIDNLSLTLYLN